MPLRLPDALATSQSQCESYREQIQRWRDVVDVYTDKYTYTYMHTTTNKTDKRAGQDDDQFRNRFTHFTLGELFGITNVTRHGYSR